MKKAAVLFLFFLFFLAACSFWADIDQSLFWKQDDLEKSRLLLSAISPTGQQRESGTLIKPAFYKGKMPLMWAETYVQSAGNLPIITSQDFGEWRNVFIYEDAPDIYYGMPNGAITIDKKTNRWLAQCKIVRWLLRSDRLTGYEIEEIHFDGNGRIKYRGRFETNHEMGFKIKDLEKTGGKDREFYFIWPTDY